MIGLDAIRSRRRVARRVRDFARPTFWCSPYCAAHFERDYQRREHRAVCRLFDRYAAEVMAGGRSYGSSDLI